VNQQNAFLNSAANCACAEHRGIIMPDATTHGSPVDLRDELQTLVGQFDAGIPKGWPAAAADACRGLLQVLQGCPAEDYDDLGRELERRLSTLIQILTGLRQPVRVLREQGYEIKNAAQLEQDIEALESLKKQILQDWPWSTQDLPPVDRKMVVESRAAMVRKDGEPIQELIRGLESDPAKSV
jgi:hypothetical protein